MDSCDCFETHWPGDEVLVKYQYISDFFIAFAYFSIPLELIYFVHKSAFFPYRWVIIQFGAFILLCGATHFINLWTFSSHYSKTVAVIMTVAKLSTAFVSCITALMLVHIIPDLLTVKTREVFLRKRVEDLDREMGLIIKQEETARHVRMLTHEIRSTLDRHTILQTTLIELGRTLDLEECALWMPSTSGMVLQLSHSLNNLIPFGSTVPINLAEIMQVFNRSEAVRIEATCPLARIRPPIPMGTYMPPQVVAVRVPLLHLSNFQIDDWPAKTYAIMVLILPLNGVRKWRDHELELVQVVADQVAVALSHAAILEESMRVHEKLMEQNVALDLARQEAEMGIHARDDFLVVMNHEMRTPMHAVIALSSLVLETQLTPEQRGMMETILKSSNLLATLINDVLDLSRLQDGTLPLENQVFNLKGLFSEVMRLINPIACVKNISMTFNCDLDLPAYGIGDEKRLMQTILNIAGNAIKFTKEGYVSVEASILSSGYATREWETPQLDGLFYLLVQVKDSGSGITGQDIPHLFTKFTESYSASMTGGGTGLGLAISKRFVNLMGGHIWVESEGLGKGTTVTLVVRLGQCSDPIQQLGVRTHQRSCSGGGELNRNTSGEDYKATASFPTYQRRL